MERRTFWACMVGSPPRGRGKETSPHLYCELSRITPAWAGKSGSGSCYCLGSGDHPRMGGEKQNSRLPWTPWTGSPPHGRGKAEAVHFRALRRRITPAWAGKRCPHSLPRHFWQDHPRMGGEKHAVSLSFPRCGGSPPHGRGKVCDNDRFTFLFGITPAWAGKRTAGWAFCGRWCDHPRMGGEKEP